MFILSLVLGGSLLAIIGILLAGAVIRTTCPSCGGRGLWREYDGTPPAVGEISDYPLHGCTCCYRCWDD